MDKSPFLNRRVIAFLLLFAAVLTIICFVLYSVGQPKFNVAATATKAKNTQVAGTATEEILSITQLAGNEMTAQSQTQTAFPTNTAIPTSTVTDTPTPVLEGCLIDVKPGSFVYEGPSLGLRSLKLESNEVMALAEAQNLGWIRVSDDNTIYAWIRKDALKASSCQLKSLPLTFLTGWSVDQRVVLEENFSTINDWIYQPSGDPISPVVRIGENFQVLPFGKERQSTEVSLRSPFGYLNNFSLRTSFSWLRSGNFGVRFWNNQVSYYDVVLTPECYAEVYDSGKILISRQVLTEKKCYNQGNGETVNYFELNIQGNTMSLKINEAEPINNYSLPAPYNGENISLITTNSMVDLEYFVLTTGN